MSFLSRWRGRACKRQAEPESLPWRARWDACPDCGWPMREHPPGRAHGSRPGFCAVAEFRMVGHDRGEFEE